MRYQLSFVKWLAATSVVIATHLRFVVGRRWVAAILAFTICSGVTTHAQTIEWMELLEIPGRFGHGVSADGLGNVYLSGHFTGTETFGDAFFSKYDSAGNLIWVRELVSRHQDEGQAVSADRLGNVFVAGETGGGKEGVGVGGVVLALNAFDAYLAKYDSSGNVAWVRQVPGTEWAYSVSADGLGNAYISGTTDTKNAYLGKYDAAGDLVWIQEFGVESGGLDSARAVSSDAFGNAYVAGGTRGNLVGPIAGEVDAFLAKYDPAGNQLWIRQFGTTDVDFGEAVSADGLANVYVAGPTVASFDELDSGRNDVFLSKYDESGNVLWTRQLGSPAAEGIIPGSGSANPRIGVSADRLGNVYLAGTTEGSLGGPNSGGDNNPLYKSDAFLARYDGDGNLDWIWQDGTGNFEAAAGVSADGLGNAYVSGSTQCHGDGCLQEDAYGFIAKVNPSSVIVVDGDFNTNGELDVGDLDLMAIGMANNVLRFDLDNDRDADVPDRLVWINDRKRTWAGDSDLNGEFNSSDLVSVLSAGKYETSAEAGWASGDWDGDRRFSSSDMVLAFVQGGYERGPRAASPVPEPAGVVLLGTALLGLAVQSRRGDPRSKQESGFQASHLARKLRFQNIGVIFVAAAMGTISTQCRAGCLVNDEAFSTAGGGCKDLATGFVWSPDMRALGNFSGGNSPSANTTCGYFRDRVYGGFTDWRGASLAEIQTALSHGLYFHLDFFDNGSPDDDVYRWTTTQAKKKKGQGYMKAIRYADGDVVERNHNQSDFWVSCVRLDDSGTSLLALEPSIVANQAGAQGVPEPSSRLLMMFSGAAFWAFRARHAHHPPRVGGGVTGWLNQRQRESPAHPCRWRRD